MCISAYPSTSGRRRRGPWRNPARASGTISIARLSSLGPQWDGPAPDPPSPAVGRMPGDVLASEPPLLCLLRVSCALCHGTALAMRSTFVGNEEEEREQSPVPRLRNDRPKNRSAPPARDDRPACGPHGALTDPGRTWRRQRQPGPPHSCRLGPPALLLHEGQLRGSTRRPLRG